MKGTLTIPKGVKEVSVEASVKNNTIIFEIVPETIVRKNRFKRGDKIIFNKATLKNDSGNLILQELYEAECKAFTVSHYSGNNEFLFLEESSSLVFQGWFEPSPKQGDMVIAWDKPEDARIGVLTEFDEVAGFVPFKLNNGVWYLFAIKWDGTREQYENVLNGKITLDP